MPDALVSWGCNTLDRQQKSSTETLAAKSPISPRPDYFVSDKFFSQKNFTRVSYHEEREGHEDTEEKGE
ncbi:MAG: hypothetical protein JW719_09410 [Pirellulales bacterium]|nr:hypothetical protein [Pirellulales bacterium]